MDEIKGVRFANMDTLTKVSLKGGKSNPFKDRVFKKTVGSHVILANTTENVYENMVKKRLIEEGKDHTQFKLKPRTWGVRVGDTPFIDHSGKIYLECIFIKGGKSVYLVDGVETDPEEIQGLEIKKEETENLVDDTKEKPQGGLENQVIIRTYDISSIEKIRTGGKEFE
jgi:hypothetical protein